MQLGTPATPRPPTEATACGITKTATAGGGWWRECAGYGEVVVVVVVVVVGGVRVEALA